MLMSFDGKISIGHGDERDFDTDLPTVRGVAEGVNQYYALEEQTDLVSFNKGKSIAKVGWNEKKEEIDRLTVSFVIVDNLPHLTGSSDFRGVRYSRKLALDAGWTGM